MISQLMVLKETLPFWKHCPFGNIALLETLPFWKHCPFGNIALLETLPFPQYHTKHTNTLVGSERQLPDSEILILVGTSGFYRITRRQVDTYPEALCMVLDMVNSCWEMERRLLSNPRYIHCLL